MLELGLGESCIQNHQNQARNGQQAYHALATKEQQMVTGASKALEPSSLHSDQKTTTKILDVWLVIEKSNTLRPDQNSGLEQAKPGVSQGSVISKKNMRTRRCFNHD